METIDLGPLYKAGFTDGAEAVINEVSKWLDEDTIESLKEEFLPRGGK